MNFRELNKLVFLQFQFFFVCINFRQCGQNLRTFLLAKFCTLKVDKTKKIKRQTIGMDCSPQSSIIRKISWSLAFNLEVSDF